MKFCFPPGILFPSPPLSKSTQGKIFFRVGKFAEDKVSDAYVKFTGRSNFFPVPIDADDFRDGNRQLSSKTLYFAYLVAKNPDVDKTKLEQLMNDRAIRGPDGQILYIPDFISEKAPAQKRFYEVKPGLANESNQEGEKKIASVRSLMQDVDLPYAPGTAFKPQGQITLFDQIVFLPPPALLPLPVKVTLEFKRHDRIDGLVVYHFCIEANFKKAIALALIIALLAVIILAVLFPELLKDIPLPPIPIPRIPELPPPRPSPVPVPPKPIPVPAIFQQFKSFLDSFPGGQAASPLQHHAIKGSVGQGGVNQSGDVQIIQMLLNIWQSITVQPPLEIDGFVGPITIGSITTLQRAAGLQAVDGRVDPGGPTIAVLGKLLMAGVATAARTNQLGSPRVFGPGIPEIDLLTVFSSALSRK